MLLPDQDARVTAALAIAERNAAEANRLRPGVVSSAWSWLIGASSAASAINADADATLELYQTLTRKANDWRGSSTPVEDAEVSDLEQAAGATSNEAAIQAAGLLTPSEALKQTAAGMLSPSTWPPWLRTALLWAAVAAVALLVLPYFVTAVLRSLAGGRK